MQRKREYTGNKAFHASLGTKKKSSESKTDANDSGMLSDLIRQEVLKIMKGKIHMDPIQVNFAQTDDFVGINLMLPRLTIVHSNFCRH